MASSKSTLTENKPALRKVSSHLLRARALAARGKSATQIRQELPIVRLKDDLLEIEVRLEVLTPAIVEEVRELGMHLMGYSYEYARIDGRIAPDLLDKLAAIPRVSTIHPNYGGQRWIGATTSQGDASTRADLARSTLAVDGSGVAVGILSDSFHDGVLGGGSVSGTDCGRTLTGAEPQTTMDLPASVVILESGPGGGSDEGAAIGEIVTDMAPGAELLFHSANNSLSDFADGITELRDCGADVIVDDFLYFAEPMFQDGVVAQAAQEAVDAGVAFVAAAGNTATFGIDQIFEDSDATDDMSFPPTGDDFHDFGGGDTFAAITIPDGCGVRAVLQWNEPFGAALGSGASSDLDFYLCPSEAPCEALVDALEFSVDQQGCGDPPAPGGDPLETFEYKNTGGSPVTGYLAVEHVCGDEAVRFRIATFASDCEIGDLTFEPGIFDDSQMYGHSTAKGVIAVAAADYREIDAGGSFQGGAEVNVEAASSLGGQIPFYFDDTGTALPGAPVTRSKPELTGPDGVNTTFFGKPDPSPGGSFEADDFPNFFGTSAAAAHVAGAAALMLEASPMLVPAGLTQVLAASALDIEAAGRDDLSGNGLVDALDAVQTLSAAGTGCIDDLVLSDQTLIAAHFFRACVSISTGPGFAVGETADVTFRAGESVTLTDGFEARGSFTAELDPSLNPT